MTLNELRSSFLAHYMLWKADTQFMSTNQFYNIHFRDLISLGRQFQEKMIIVVGEHLKKNGPDMIVNLLPIISDYNYVSVKGFVYLEDICNAWIEVAEKLKECIGEND